MLELISPLLNTKSDIDRKAYNKQRNYVVISLLRNEVKNFYSNLGTKVVTGNSVFWETVKTIFVWKVYEAL